MLRLLLLLMVVFACESRLEDEEDTWEQPEDSFSEGISSPRIPYFMRTRSRRQEEDQQEIPHKQCMKEVDESMLCMCKARPVSMDVVGHRSSFNTYPRCIMVNRCSGPCWRSSMKCMPTKTREIQVPTVTHDCRRQYEAMEEHVKCFCTCPLTEQDCNDNQSLNRKRCSCDCTNRRRCPDGTIWNEKSCTCKCLVNRECSTGFYLDPHTCRCALEELNENSL